MNSGTTKMTQGGRVVIPAEARKRLGMHVGETLRWEITDDDELKISSRERDLRRAQELFRKYVPEGTPVVDDFLADRRKEAADE
ncbi:MAG: AbrB/MazE/SpoVT family DNA-binding domain-containing protein [Acidobacteria bacterium]|nr:AbrB/MazE/SpoVT family DNA-binding domain-containing protein [Acidobacteriota bacterium]